jgi:hypothetical protein
VSGRPGAFIDALRSERRRRHAADTRRRRRQFGVLWRRRLLLLAAKEKVKKALGLRRTGCRQTYGSNQRRD